MSNATLLPEEKSENLVWPFPAMIKAGSTVYLGLQRPVDRTGSIEDQTHQAFNSLNQEIERAGCDAANLVKLHTYYLYEGNGRNVTQYWEKMTNVRLQYLSMPGPAGTALRIRHVLPGDYLISCDGIAEDTANKVRLMPAHAWDWSIATPLSQGWLINDKKIYVGGQLSADRQGKAIHVNDPIMQIRETLNYIYHVLQEGGASWEDVLFFKIAYQHDQDHEQSQQLLDAIKTEIHTLYPNAKPALIPFGVNLLYEGLVLEIDAIAVKNTPKQILSPLGSKNWKAINDEFELAYQVDDEIYLGGISAPGGASLEAQLETIMGRVGDLLNEANADFDHLAKLNVYIVNHPKYIEHETQTIVRILQEFLNVEKTVVTVIGVSDLPREGQKIQVDGIAILNRE